jgi:hypothetical protein
MNPLIAFACFFHLTGCPIMAPNGAVMLTPYEMQYQQQTITNGWYVPLVMPQTSQGWGPVLPCDPVFRDSDPRCNPYLSQH